MAAAVVMTTMLKRKERLEREAKGANSSGLLPPDSQRETAAGKLSETPDEPEGPTTRVGQVIDFLNSQSVQTAFYTIFVLLFQFLTDSMRTPQEFFSASSQRPSSPPAHAHSCTHAMFFALTCHSGLTKRITRPVARSR